MEITASYTDDYPFDISLPDFLLKRAELYGNRPAFIDDAAGRCYTYSQLIELVARCAASLARLGLSAADRLCLLLPNCIEYPVLFLATLRLQAICVPVNGMSTKYELRETCRDCEPHFFVTTPERVDCVRFAAADLPAHRVKIITVGDSRSGCIPFESLLRPSPPPQVAAVVAAAAAANAESTATANSVQSKGRLATDISSRFDSRNVIATICFSSGTTGKPKGCMQPHYSYIANSRAFVRAYYGRSPDDVTERDDDVSLAALPMFHGWGILCFFVFGMALGEQCVVMNKFDPVEYLRLAHKYKVTMLYVVPPLLSQLLNAADSERLRYCLASARRILSAAVAIDDNLTTRVQQALPHVELSQAYGMTESQVTNVARPGTWKIGSSGQAMDVFSAKIVDQETRRTLRVNENGELLVKGPSVFRGYWNNAEATSSSFDADGWFKTGDFGHFDEQGSLYLVSRIKDLLKYKGYQVAPAELETVLLLHPDIIDAAVYGVKDDVGSDLPRAVVVTKRPNVSEQEIQAFVNERVSAYKRLRGGVEIVSEIPRTASGKILRRLLTARSTSTAAAARTGVQEAASRTQRLTSKL